MKFLLELTVPGKPSLNKVASVIENSTAQEALAEGFKKTIRLQLLERVEPEAKPAKEISREEYDKETAKHEDYYRIVVLPDRNKFLKALESFCETIEATGGVFRDRKGNYRPIGDTDWIDLGDEYIRTCALIGRQLMLVSDPDEVDEMDEEEDEVDE